MEGCLIILIVIIGVIGVMAGVGWLLCLLLNPILLNFGIPTITPFIGFLIIVLVNLVVALFKKK